VREGFLNAFLFAEGERRALSIAGHRLEVRGTRRVLTLDEALALLRGDPAAWSPGVLLRPLVQDHLLPAAAYLGGPAEVAYHAQITPSYAHFGIPHAVISPRPSVTIVEPAQARALEAEGLGLPDLQGDPEALLTGWARQDYPEVEAAFADTRAGLERDMGRVRDTLAAIDPTLRGAAEAALGRALHQVGGLHEKALRALKKRDQARADRLRRTRDALLPGGILQERGLSHVGLVTRHGLGVIDSVAGAIDLWARGHQVLCL
jgi:bacillithiol synthase